MKVIFESQTPTDGFTNWLKAFKEIDNSLLIEVDFEQSSFIAKVTTEDQALVRYSKISFDKAGFKTPEYIINDENEQVKISDVLGNARIKIGVFLYLDKIISLIKSIDAYKDGGLGYQFIIEFDENLQTGKTEWHAQLLQLRKLASPGCPTPTAFPNITCSNVSEFIEITDNIFFNKIYVLDEPVYHAKVKPESIKFVVNISALTSISGNKDTMSFYVNTDESTGKKLLYVKDGLHDRYEQLLGEFEESDVDDEIVLTTFKQKFIMATKGIESNLIFSLSKDASRIFIDTEDGNFKTVVAVVKD